MKKLLVIALYLVPSVLCAMDKDTQLCKKMHNNYRLFNSIVLPPDVENYTDAKNMLSTYRDNLERQKNAATEYKRKGNNHLYMAICALAPTLKLGSSLINMSSGDLTDYRAPLNIGAFFVCAQVTGFQLKNSILSFSRFLQTDMNEIEEELAINQSALTWIENNQK